MLKCSTSLWSADLVNLESEMRRVEPFSERFHLDVADGHYTQTLLFFPDLVAAIRRHTTLPLEVHLMTTHPLDWIDPFADAGADLFIVHLDSADRVDQILATIETRGKMAAIALPLHEPLDALEPYWNRIALVCMIGVEIGVKGVSMNPRAPERIRQVRHTIRQRGLHVEIQADGGIRRDTVPLLAEAGADYIVPGSLMFKENPQEMRQWLATL